LGAAGHGEVPLAKKEEVWGRPMSVPGVGPLTALAFPATIDRPDRFKRSCDVGAHLGLPARAFRRTARYRCISRIVPALGRLAQTADWISEATASSPANLVALGFRGQ